MKQIHFISVSIVLFLLFSFSLGSQETEQREFYVTPEGTGSCKKTAPCSLQGALDRINGSTPYTDVRKTIFLAAGTYSLRPEILIRPVAIIHIRGENPENTFLDGGRTTRVIHIIANANAEIENVTIQNGFSEATGAGIAVDRGARLTLKNSRVLSNLTRSNGNPASGAGINNLGYLNMDRVSVAHNRIQNTAGEDDHIGGAGLANVGNNRAISETEGRAVITNSTFDHNIAQVRNAESSVRGGGILNAYYGSLYMGNVTLSNNRSTGYFDPTVGRQTNFGNGGGLDNDSHAVAYISHATITGNNSNYGGGISNGAGDVTNPGGNVYGSGEVHIMNSIVAENTPTNCFAGTAPSSHGNNLTNASEVSCFGASRIDWAVDTINLDELRDNGGPTWTHKLNRGSRAIDPLRPDYTPWFDMTPSPISPLTFAYDQRGIRRMNQPDVGSYEVSAATPPLIGIPVPDPVTPPATDRRVAVGLPPGTSPEEVTTDVRGSTGPGTGPGGADTRIPGTATPSSTPGAGSGSGGTGTGSTGTGASGSSTDTENSGLGAGSSSATTAPGSSPGSGAQAKCTLSVSNQSASPHFAEGFLWLALFAGIFSRRLARKCE